MRRPAQVAVGLVVLAAALFYPWLRQQASEPGFQLISGSPGSSSLHRWQHVHIFRGAFNWQVECNIFLIKEGNDAILVDAGPLDDPLYPPLLVRVLKKALGSTRLQLVLLTHAHQDHVGALQAIFESWPDAQLAFHALEHPFLTQPIDPTNIPSNYSKHLIWLYAMSSAATPERVLHFNGSAGDVSQLSSPTGERIRWQLPEGLLTFLHVPGHAPGQVAFLHQPTRQLLAGDLFYHLTDGMSDKPVLSRIPRSIKVPNPEAVHSVKAAARLDFDRAWPAHDAGQGVSAAEYRAWAEALQDG